MTLVSPCRELSSPSAKAAANQYDQPTRRQTLSVRIHTHTPLKKKKKSQVCVYIYGRRQMVYLSSKQESVAAVPEGNVRMLASELTVPRGATLTRRPPCGLTAYWKSMLIHPGYHSASISMDRCSRAHPLLVSRCLHNHFSSVSSSAVCLAGL